MSTASGTLLAPAVTFSENILRGFYKEMSDRELLLATRGAVVVFTLMVATYALSTDATIHHMVESAYKVTLSGAFVPLAAGLFWRRANNLGAALAIIFGIGTWLGFEILVPEGEIGPQLYGVLASALGMVLGAYFGQPPGPAKENAAQAGASH
ncbi:MAG: sodium:solute symporter, partial [Azonexus sp.]|jgi:Na+/proline symporter|nr:sodium:solute symporter [Azonexus sp.]